MPHFASLKMSKIWAFERQEKEGVLADETEGFGKVKRKTCIRKGIDDSEIGDAFTFAGIERNTKLVLPGI